MLVLSKEIKKVSKSISYNGYEFDIYSRTWQLDKNKKMDLEFVDKFDKKIQEDLILTLVYFAEMKSAFHAVNMAISLKSYIDRTNKNIIDESGLLKYKSIFSAKNEEHRLGTLRVFLKQVYFLEFNAVSSELFKMLNGWRIAGNDKGLAVLSLDPEDGPYSDIEFEAIKLGLDNKYAESVIKLEEYVLAQIFACTGRRPIQIASLKIGDLSLNTSILDKPVFIISVPKAKVRGGKFRGSFKKVALDDQIGITIKLHIKNLIKSAEIIFERKLSKSQINSLPLFPDDIKELKNLSNEDFEMLLKSDVVHCKSSKITDELQSVISKLEIISERTGRKLYTNGYRFRYTLGTRAAREGAGVLTIAELLDHSDTQNTGVYVANVPEHATTISLIMNNSLMRYANAFQGEVVLNEKDVLTNIPNAPRIRNIDSKSNLGSCGTCNNCHQFAPLACYVCPKFKPWRDAPHEIILKWLVDERQRIIDETNDMEIAAINDRVIIAVNQVIERCSALKQDPQYEQ